MGTEATTQIDPNFAYKAAVSERMAYVHQLINTTNDPELLSWIRNKLSKPYGKIMRKLDDIDPARNAIGGK